MSNLRQILSEEGLRVAADDELEKRFEQALQGLIKEANLPSNVKFKGAKSQSASIPVPKGFESLFTKISIDLQVERGKWGLWGRLKWSYKHPSGSNGLMIGTISANEEDLQAGWRMEDGRYGDLDAPR